MPKTDSIQPGQGRPHTCTPPPTTTTTTIVPSSIFKNVKNYMLSIRDGAASMPARKEVLQKSVVSLEPTPQRASFLENLKNERARRSVDLLPILEREQQRRASSLALEKMATFIKDNADALSHKDFLRSVKDYMLLDHCFDANPYA